MPVVCRFAPSGLEIHCRPREVGRSTTRRGQRRRFGQQPKGSGGVHLRPLGAKFKFEALQFLNFGIRFYWVVVISGLSGQTSLKNNRSKLDQLSNLVVRFHSNFTFWRFPLSTLTRCRPPTVKRLFVWPTCTIHFLGNFNRPFLYSSKAISLGQYRPNVRTVLS